MEENTEENGSTTTWMELESTLGKMAVNTKASTKMTKSRGMEYIHGLMVVNTKATGGEESSTASAATQFPEHQLSSGYGKRASALNGSTRTHSN